MFENLILPWGELDLDAGKLRLTNLKTGRHAVTLSSVAVRSLMEGSPWEIR